MKYLLMLVGPDYDFSTVPEEQVAADLAAHGAYVEFLNERGIAFSGEALQTRDTATTLRLGAGGEVIVTDGPYADLKEQIGGFYLVDVKDLDEALEIARRCPMGEGAIEVRPVYPTE